MTDKNVTRLGWIAAAIYVALLVGLITALYLVRRNAIASLGSPQEQQAWDQWRAEARRHDGTEGTVKRRVPSSTEPPALLLLRDHFGACVVGAVVLTSILYWSSAFFVRGALFGPTFLVEGPRRD